MANVNRFFSVGPILSALTCLFVVLLALLAANIAFEAFHRERAATDTLAVIHIERTMLSSKEIIRIELGVLNAAFDAPDGASPGTTDHIFTTHARLNESLASVIEELGAYSTNRDRRPTIPSLPDPSLVSRPLAWHHRHIGADIGDVRDIGGTPHGL